MTTGDLITLCQRAYSEPTAVTADGRDAFRFDEIAGRKVLTFRGTLTEGKVAWSDWANDFEARHVEAPDHMGSVHEGFLNSFRALLPLLPRLSYGAPLVVTGHSKGGALAFLFGRHFGASSVVTFGAPRVGDRRWASSYAVPTTRYEHLHDIVPTVPRLRYYHVGIAVRSPEIIEDYGLNWAKCHSLDTGYRPWVPNASF